MAGTTPIDLYQAFLEAAGQQTAELSDVRYALETVITQLGLTEPTGQPVAAVKATSSSSSSSSSTTGGSDSTLVKVLKSGLGVAPLIGSLIGLFGGGASEEPAPFVKYAMPASVNIEAAQRGGQITTSDYDQMGMARGFGNQPATGRQATAGPPQITVNVQAMDARSFLDRSGDIAMAVRDAMLNSNSINDVVNDL
jgi:hypothetical protein